MSIQENLQNYGLSEKETGLYLAALRTGTAPIARLAKEAGLKRPTAYLIIEDLLKKDLLIAIPRRKKTYYQAVSPEKLVDFIEDRKEKIKAIMPELIQIHQSNLKQAKVRFYEGKNQIYKMYEEIFRSKEIRALFSYDNFLEVFTEKDSRHFFNLLNRHEGIIYDMAKDTKKGRELLDLKHRKGLSETKILPKEMDFKTDILVFDNKVALVSFDNLTGVIIEDENIFNAQRMLLRFVWEKI